MREERKIIYYEDELNDEFSTAVITPRRIDGNYKYMGGAFRKIGRVFWYHIIAKHIAWLYLKVKYNHKIVGKEKIKEVKGQGFFLYGNHTNAVADPLIPTMICRPVSVYVVVHPNNVSMPILGRLIPTLGGLPLPDDKEAIANFNNAIDIHIKKRRCVTIYPEAHIWPYYTKIRNFKDNSFRYPAKLKTPVFCFTNTYQKRKNKKIPQIVTYVDGPFYCDESVSQKEARVMLHKQVITSMKKYCEYSNVEMIKYVKKED